MGWIIASLFFYFCAYLTIVDTTELGDEKPLVLLFFLVVATILLVVFIRKRVNSVREKAEEEREKREDEQRWERIARVDAAIQRAEKQAKEQRLAQLRQRFSNNPIIHVAVPAAASKYVQEMLQKQPFDFYQKKKFRLRAETDHISISIVNQSSYKCECDTIIQYGKYGLPRIGDQDQLNALVDVATQTFIKELQNNFSVHSTKYRINSQTSTSGYSNASYDCYVECEIGFADSRSW